MRSLASLTGLLLLTGCALMQRGASVNVRYYEPEPPPPNAASAATGPAVQLRLGQVAAGSDLGERIMHSDGRYEVGFYESRRWSDLPETYVRQALVRVLFDSGGFRQAVEGRAPTLTVQILSFTEVTNGTNHVGRVVLRGVLSTDVEVFADTFAANEPVEGTRFEDVVAAISRALSSVCEQIAARVHASLVPPAVGSGPEATQPSCLLMASRPDAGVIRSQ
jgi:cholesterol transport system auxiliary component